MRKLLGVIALLFGMVAFGAAPASAVYVGENPDGAVLDSTVRAGQTVTFVADCFEPGALVTVTVSGPASAMVTVAGGTTASDTASGEANATGDITAYIKTSVAGNYTVTATGERAVCGSGAASADFTVVAAAAAPAPGTGTGSGSGAGSGAGVGSGSLADTGANGVATQLWLGVALLGVGAFLVALTVRRRASNV